MSFHLTAEDIRIDNNHILVGRLRATDGSLRDTSIDLDRFLGNENGLFKSLLAFAVSTSILTAIPQAISSGMAKVGYPLSQKYRNMPLTPVFSRLLRDCSERPLRNRGRWTGPSPTCRSPDCGWKLSPGRCQSLGARREHRRTLHIQ
jgi:hypothetical protein